MGSVPCRSAAAMSSKSCRSSLESLVNGERRGKCPVLWSVFLSARQHATLSRVGTEKDVQFNRWPTPLGSTVLTSNTSEKDRGVKRRQAISITQWP
jgi:hypothetical protein